MKIYVCHSSAFDFRQELYLPIRESELDHTHQITLPHENSDSPFNSKEFLKNCDLVIAEISYPSISEGIEIGWADQYQVPIICIYKTGSTPPRSLKVITDKFIEYSSPQDLIAKLKSQLN